MITRSASLGEAWNFSIAECPIHPFGAGKVKSLVARYALF
jgi:hypothetical protein